MEKPSPPLIMVEPHIFDEPSLIQVIGRVLDELEPWGIIVGLSKASEEVAEEALESLMEEVLIDGHNKEGTPVEAEHEEDVPKVQLEVKVGDKMQSETKGTGEEHPSSPTQ